MKIARGLAAATVLAALTGADATAQTAVAESDLRARQEALFAQLFEDPDNLELMFDHALTSIALKDYEAAISTLERMLIFNPKLARAKVELGAAYFRLGAYENARYYFEDVMANDNPPPEVQRRVNGFLDEIGRRTQESGANLVATFGVTYSSNANLGPSNRNVLLGGNISQIDEAFVESQDIGFRTTVQGTHFIDLNQPDGDAWTTDLSLFSLHYLDETLGDLDTATIRSGPRLSLDEQNYGPKLRPFIEADVVRSNNELLYATFGGGFEYSDTLDDKTNLFATVQSAWREYADRNDFDGTTHRATVGMAYTPDPGITLSALLIGETDRTERGFNSNYEIGARLGAVYRYDPGFEFTDRLWSLAGFAGATYRKYDDPNPAISPRTREDKDFRAGVSHVFHLTGGWFFQADADVLVRDSNIRNFDIESVGVGLSVGRSF